MFHSKPEHYLIGQAIKTAQINLFLFDKNVTTIVPRKHIIPR